MSIITRYTIILILLSLMFLVPLQPVASENNKITLEYFYGEDCESCNLTGKPIINNIEQSYGDKITIKRYSVEDDPETENYQKMVNYYGFEYYPAIVVLNQSSGSYTKFSYDDLDDENLLKPLENLKSTIDLYLAGENEETQVDQDITFNALLIIGLIAIALVIVVLIKKRYKFTIENNINQLIQFYTNQIAQYPN